MRLPIHQVDAFTSRVFGGNPAAVCPLEHWLSDELLGAIALENNLSETAFLVRAERDVWDLRWFTPAVEVDLCGHATLASGWVVLERLEPALDRASFDTRSGRLAVERAEERLRMDLPAIPPEEPRLPNEILACIDADVRESFSIRAVHGALYGLVVLDSEAAVRAVRPDVALLGELGANVIVTAPGDPGEPGAPDDAVDFVSRFFAPASGIAEDPVTGSAHSTLAPYWAARLGRTRLDARQVSARGGALTCEVQGDRVALYGSCAPYLEGWIDVPG